jgi:hypothetical protein
VDFSLDEEQLEFKKTVIDFAKKYSAISSLRTAIANSIGTVFVNVPGLGFRVCPSLSTTVAVPPIH